MEEKELNLEKGKVEQKIEEKEDEEEEGKTARLY